MTKPSLKEVLGRLGPIRAISRVRSGSRGSVKITPAGELAKVNTIAATHALARRGLSMKVAKTAIETMVEEGGAQVSVPTIESSGKLAEDLLAAGVNAVVVLETVPVG